jgi:hypothetical protein
LLYLVTMAFYLEQRKVFQHNKKTYEQSKRRTRLKR